MESAVDGKVQELWESVVSTCNKVLSHADLYGFQLMSLPNPNIHHMAKLFDTVVIPILDDLARNHEFSPVSGMKMANIRTYALHLRAITIAINDDNKESFNYNVNLLMSESML